MSSLVVCVLLRFGVYVSLCLFVVCVRVQRQAGLRWGAAGVARSGAGRGRERGAGRVRTFASAIREDMFWIRDSFTVHNLN